MTTHTTADTAARRLADVLRWKHQPFTPRTPLTAIRYDADVITGSRASRLPFPADSVFTDGAAGVETPAGADQWIELWAAWLSWALDTPTAKADGPWLLQQLQEHKDLHPLPDPSAHEDDADMCRWATGFLVEWDKFTRELTRLWWRLAHLTGHGHQTRTTCPHCRQGELQSTWTRAGLADTATCNTCRLTINYAAEEITASIRAALRDPNLTDTWLTLTELRTIWPRLKPSTLRSRVHNGHVRKAGDRYNLADINTWQWERT